MKQRGLPTLMLCLVLLAPTPSFAVLGEENAWFAKIVAAMKTQYDTLQDSLNEYKQANETLSEVKDIANDAIKEYDAVQNAAATDWVGMLKRDLDALTSLDSLSGKSREQQVRIMLDELERRIDDPEVSDAEKEIAAHQIQLIKKREEIAKLGQVCRESLLKSSGAATERELMQAQTQCAAAQAIIEATAAEEQKSKEITASEDASEAEKFMNSSASAFRKMAESMNGKKDGQK